MPHALSLLIVTAVAMALSAALVPAVKRLARAVGAVDAPGGRRVHARITPRMGGVAIFFAYAGSLGLSVALGWFPWRTTAHKPLALGAILAAGGALMLVGAFDDAKALGAKKKLLVQTAVALLAWWAGARIERVDLPGLPPIVFPVALSLVLTVGWILAFVNAINLIDGLDGLAGGVVFFAALTNSAVAFLTGNMLAGVLNAALGGAVLGFLFYNFNPASIFMGDAGSMFLGYVLGTTSLLTSRQKESTVVSLLVPIIALGLPLADTIFAMVRRFLARRPIFSADRGHIHHKLLDLGLTHRRAVLVLYGATILLCVAATGAAFGKNWHVGAALVGAFATLFGIARFAGYFEATMLRNQQRALLLSAPTDSLRRALPALIVAADRARSSAEVWAALERVLDGGWFAYAEHVAPGEQAPVWHWRSSERNGRVEGRLCEVEFRLRAFPGAKEGTVRFGCLSDESHVPPQVEVLLQVAVDAVEQALVRQGTESPGSTLRLVSGAAPDDR